MGEIQNKSFFNGERFDCKAMEHCDAKLPDFRRPCQNCAVVQALFLCNICMVFRPVLAFRDLLFIHASTNATDDHKYSLFPSQILTFPKFWYHLAD